MILRRSKTRTIVTILLSAFFLVRVILALDSFAQVAYNLGDFTEKDSSVTEGSSTEENNGSMEEKSESEDASQSANLEEENDVQPDDASGGETGEKTLEDQEDESENGSEPEPEPEPEVSIISCFGDSVTLGTPYAGTSNTYPAKLQSLINSNFGSGSFVVINRGVGGYRADQVLASTPSWLSSDNPKVVLLMVGGNDLNQELTIDSTLEEIQAVVAQTVSEVQQIVNICKAHTNPDGTHPRVILSAFIPNNYQGVWGSMAIAYYNSGLSGVTGEDVYFTDNWSDFYDTSTFQAKTSLMYDTFHPNASGYSIIAGNWYNRITPYLD
jgi:lysophospholipase L1-like esterase